MVHCSRLISYPEKSAIISDPAIFFVKSTSIIDLRACTSNPSSPSCSRTAQTLLSLIAFNHMMHWCEKLFAAEVLTLVWDWTIWSSSLEKPLGHRPACMASRKTLQTQLWPRVGIAYMLGSQQGSLAATFLCRLLKPWLWHLQNFDSSGLSLSTRGLCKQFHSLHHAWHTVVPASQSRPKERVF